MTADGFDLGGYLARIGLLRSGGDGPLAPDLATLRRLVAGQAAAIPFEGIDALIGRTPALDPAGLQAKLIGAGRGGWCFEQNSLLALALAAIGFAARPLLARVVFGLPPGAVLSRTHMVLRVELPEGPFLADAGFGAMTMTGPIALHGRDAQPTPHGPFRLRDRPDGLLLEALVGGDWTALYLIGADPQLPADVEAANWLVANRPATLFTANLVASRAPPGERITLLNRRLTLRPADGPETVTLLPGPALGEALCRHFGLALDAAELAAIDAALVEPRPGQVPAMG